jgi:hypothetical protein
VWVWLARSGSKLIVSYHRCIHYLEGCGKIKLATSEASCP